MKRLLALLILMGMTAGAFAQPVNQKDAKGRKQGKWEKKYPKSNAYEYKGEFKDDKPVGTFTYYYPSSKVKAVIVHNVATGRSVATMYHESGVLFAKGIYKNQLKDSIWDYYGPSARQSMKETYKSNKLNGFTTIYYVPEDVANKSLLPAKVSSYVNGILEGDEVEFFETGTVKSKGKYVAGKRDGLYFINHPNGKPMVMERYKKGVRHGWCSAYDGNGKEIGKKYYYYGRLLEGRELDKKLEELKKRGIDPNK